jgi:predicted nucleic acid-binding protein
LDAAKGLVVELDATIAMNAAWIGLDARLPLADSVMLASARATDATLWTQDAHFAGIEGVMYVPRVADTDD